MTHNTEKGVNRKKTSQTKEIPILEDFDPQLLEAVAEIKGEGYAICDEYNSTDNLEDVARRLLTIFYERGWKESKHHQLQKAREEEKERIVRITTTNRDAFMMPATEQRWSQAIHSELDQDNK